MTKPYELELLEDLSSRRFPVNEIFGPTIQGEGSLAGAITHFVRLNGCDYRCSWCDTLDAVLPERYKDHNELLTATQIREKLQALPKAGMVTLSGGNPAIFKDGVALVEELQHFGWKVAMETQGSIFQPWFNLVDYVIISPKPPSSGMDHKLNITELDRCIRVSRRPTLKVVIFEPEDLDFAIKIHKAWPKVPFYLQVGGSLQRQEILEMLYDYQRLVQTVMDRYELADCYVLPQLHKYLFGHGRGV